MGKYPYYEQWTVTYKTGDDYERDDDGGEVRVDIQLPATLERHVSKAEIYSACADEWEHLAAAGNACRSIPTDQLAGLDVGKVLEERDDAQKEVARLERQRKRHDDEICSALRIGRHHELVDKSFLEGLTPEEEAEDKRICDGMEAFDTRYYKPSIELLDQLAHVNEERDEWRAAAEKAAAQMSSHTLAKALQEIGELSMKYPKVGE